MDVLEEHSHKMIPRFPNYSDRDKSVEIGDAPVYLRKRYLVTLLVFLDWILISLMQINLGISIVRMTSNTTVTVGNESFIQEAEFHWPSEEKGILLSAFPLGIMVAPLGVLVTNKFGIIRTFGTATAITGCLTLLTPFILSWSTAVYMVVRIAEGVFDGIAYSSVAEVLRLWSIPSEQNRIFATVPAGILLAIVIGFPACGTILHLLNWRAVFYIIGSISVIWSILWFSLVSTPQKDKLISAKERRFIQAVNKYTSTRKVAYPWKDIFKSKVVWAYCNDRFVEAWTMTFLTYGLPMYIKDVHDVDIQDVGFISGIPHFCGIFGMVGASVLADFLIKHGISSTSSIHRLYFNSFHLMAIILLITATLWTNVLANIIIFGIFCLCYNVACISYMIFPVEVAGQYSPAILGLGTTGYAFGSFSSPVVMGLIVSNDSPSKWSIYFAVLSAFNLWGAIIFYWFGSIKLQPWAMPSHKPSFQDYENEKKNQLVLTES